MAIIDTITANLHKMTQADLVKVLQFMNELSPEIAKRQREGLAASYGAMNNEQGEIFEAAVLGEEVTEPEK